MSSVLIAPLRDHPVVVTAAVDALSRGNISIDRVELLVPDDPVLRHGRDWAALELDCDVQVHDLPFADANSEEAAKQYLQMLAFVLERCEEAGDEAHLLLSGGRKNMAALTAVIAQFYPCIRSLWHVLDIHERDPQRHNFFSVVELLRMDDATRRRRLFPPQETVNLFKVLRLPSISDAVQRRMAFAALAREELPAVADPGALEAFWTEVFGPQRPDEPLDLWVSERAVEDYADLPSGIYPRFEHCFAAMSSPQLLKKHRHQPFHRPFQTDCNCFNADANPARPFYYQDGRRLVLCRLVYHPGTYERLIGDRNTVFRADHPPVRRLRELAKGRGVLVVPLGETPMVATQAYVLLKDREGLDLTRVVLLYPAESSAISNLASDLSSHFRREGVAVDLRPMEGLADVDSTAACTTYLRTVTQALCDLQGQVPDQEVHLLISGGRKSMAALNLFAAQHAGLARVWHTLVKTPALEDRIVADLKNAPNSTERRRILFLRGHDRESFVHFPVPVFPLPEA